MYVLLNKLQRLKPSLKIFSKPITDVKISIVKARANLQTTQLNMCNDRLNTDKIELVKKHTEGLLNLQELEEKVLKQKAKLDWLKLGDGNNKYFYASIKVIHKMKSMSTLLIDDGTFFTTQ